MKRLILVGGPMGVGKSAVCSALLERLQPGAYLDGDWCWNIRPFMVSEETKAMVLDNICAILTRFLACEALENVIFGWVLHQQEIWDEICRRLPLSNVEVQRFVLLASPETLRRRVERDVAAGRPIAVPKNYYPGDDPSKEPIFRWRAHGYLLYTNWLNYYVYQDTPYDLSQLEALKK